MLAFTGRLQLLKAVLCAIQSFWSNHFLLPKATHKHLQSLFTKFLWKGDISKQGGAKIAWDNLCLPKEEGGLGIKHPIQWNHAQLLYHFWRILSKKDTIWVLWVQKTLLKRKNLWAASIPTDTSWLWKKLLKSRDEVKEHISYSIGNGNSIAFWLDPWWNGAVIVDSPNASVIRNSLSQAYAKVNDFIRNGSWHLPVTNFRHRHSPELNNWMTSFGFLGFDLSRDDRILWNNTPANKVTARDIWDSVREVGETVLWFSAVWFKGGVARYTYVNWLLCNNRLNTLDRLLRFGLVSSNSCHLCAGGFETASHLFINCPYSSYILNNIVTQLQLRLRVHQGPPGQSQSQMQHVLDNSHFWAHLLISASTIHGQSQRYITLLSLQTFAYHIWRERNQRAHGHGIFGPSKLLQGIRVDIKSRLASSTWFSKEICNHPQLYSWFA